MTPAERIDKLGFRRWYERELIEGHAYLVTGFLSFIVIAVFLEEIDWRGSFGHVAYMLAVISIGVAACAVAVRRYGFFLARAERLGGQSSCAKCGAYGVLQVLAAGEDTRGPRGLFSISDNAWIRVRCRKCGHEWRMDNV